jgi:hypothetical protein
MSTLSDRYVWGVLRAVPSSQRADLEPEVRALVADAVEARVDAGEDRTAAERAALQELGDPELLAARYTDRSLVLIGPRYYPEWRRLLTLLLPIVVPLAIIVTTAAAWMGGKPGTELIGVAVTSGIGVTTQLVFWVTLVFALLERSGEVPPLGEAWSPDKLPETPAESVRPNLVETVLSIVALGVLGGVLVWQQVAMPVTIDGTSYPIVNPALWSFWIPWFLLVIALEIGFTLVRWARGGWTWVLAAMNVVLGLAFVVPAIWLVTTGQLLDPGLVAAIEAEVGTSAWLQPTLAIGATVALVIFAWDSFDGFRQAWIRSRS